jgi:hypothetical protein
MQALLISHIVALAAIVGGGAITLAQNSAAPGQPTAPVSQDAGTRDVGTAAQTPLRNANLVRQEIPPVLTAAMADPYGRPRPFSCKVIAVDVADLTTALGADFDANVGTGKPGMAPTAVKLAANTFIPFQGVLRYVSGAEAHDRLLVRAIIAGSARRSYLKGLGEAHGCGAPAAPKRADAAPVHRRKR